MIIMMIMIVFPGSGDHVGWSPLVSQMIMIITIMIIIVKIIQIMTMIINILFPPRFRGPCRVVAVFQ